MLGANQIQLGEAEAARKHLERALAVFRKAAGDIHPTTAVVMELTARALEAASAARLEEVAPVLGRHFAAAGEAEPGLRYLVMAGDHATEAFANDEAISSYRAALAGIDGLERPCPDEGGSTRSWFVFVVQLPRGVDRDETVRALAARGIQSKPYLPAIHLMSFYRERFGHREGEFPVCEDVAARSLALPFFPQMSEGQVAQVSDGLRSALGR